MNKKRSKFTFEQRKILEQNPYIETVSYNTLTYTEDFKILIVLENLKGDKTAVQIFESYGFSVAEIGEKRMRSSVSTWTIKYQNEGPIGLIDKRKANGQGKIGALEQEKYEKSALVTQIEGLMKKLIH
ncbi:MAG: helix-turn-helix domain-containing protein [Culicoidibacterales bacterium]